MSYLEVFRVLTRVGPDVSEFCGVGAGVWKMWLHWSLPCTKGSGSNDQAFFYPSSSQQAPGQRGDSCRSV